MASTYVIAASVVRVNAYQYKASWGDGSYAGSFAGLRDAQALIERSISPGAAPLAWKRQEREDGVELWYVLKDASGAFLGLQSRAVLHSGLDSPPASIAPARESETPSPLAAMAAAALEMKQSRTRLFRA